MKISLLHPSRSRPQKAFETARKWIDKAGVEVEYILSLDESDVYQKAYFGVYGFGGSDWPDKLGFRSTTTGYNCLLSENRSAVDAINIAAKIATGDILMVLSDDFDCFDNWGVALLKELEGKEDFILKTQDGIQDWIITMPIMDRKYYNRFGYVYYPEYLHMFCDTELSCVADLTGRKLTSKLMFKHNHYSVAGGKDAVSERADKTWAQGENLFIQRYKKNFDLVNPPGKIQSQTYLNWIKQKGL